MDWLLNGIALLLAVAIIGIGSGYILRPMIMACSFGLPYPEDGANIPWWLRLKGIRDIVAGLLVLAFVALGNPRELGIILLIEAMIPLGDMLLVLSAKGSGSRALGIHGLTALVMILVSAPMISGVY